MRPRLKSKERTTVTKRRALRARSPRSCPNRLTPMWWCLMMTNRELEPPCPIKLPSQWSPLTLYRTPFQLIKKPSPQLPWPLLPLKLNFYKCLYYVSWFCFILFLLLLIFLPPPPSLYEIDGVSFSFYHIGFVLEKIMLSTYFYHAFGNFALILKALCLYREAFKCQR